MKQTTDKVSFLISLYKNEDPEYFRLAMESVLSQSVPAAEVVLVIDGPITLSLERIVSKLEPHICVVRRDQNGGLAEALNTGLRHVKTRWVARMDTDDICHLHRIKRQVQVANSVADDVAVIGTWAVNIDESGNTKSIRKVPCDPSVVRSQAYANPVIHPTAMIRTSVLRRLKGYRTWTKRCEDLELWFRVLHDGYTIVNLPEPLLFYREYNNHHLRNPLRVGISRAIVSIRGAIRLKLQASSLIMPLFFVVRSILPAFVVTRFLDIHPVRKVRKRIGRG